jgi:hypothetical protein
MRSQIQIEDKHASKREVGAALFRPQREAAQHD